MKNRDLPACGQVDSLCEAMGRVVGMLMVLLAGLLPGSLSAADRPNILFIFADDLTCQALSSFGDHRQLLETPHIDRLAREGMRFDRCLVTNSICGPSRATILTGKYSHKNGFYNNSTSTFDSSQTTFPKLLQGAGYQTAVIGKWHLVSDPTGFDHWHVLPGQGIYYNPPMIRMGEKMEHRGYVTDLITDLSLQWLAERDRDRPFLLMTQHKAPHREWAPPTRLLGWDADRVYPEPATLFDDFSGRSSALADHDMGLLRTFTPLDSKLVPPPGIDGADLAAWNAYYEPRNAAFRAADPQGEALVRWRYNRYMHDYLGCVKALDENVGRILDLLDREGIADSTVVVLASDQGFFLGEHGWFDKRWILEESLRAPLLVRWPGRTPPGSSCKKIVSLIDFAPTFLEMAGVAVPSEMQGRSLMPLLSGKNPADWRTSLYYRYYEFPLPHRVRPHLGVITDRYKLVHYEGSGVDDWELLDREADPLETKNFIAEPGHAEVLRELQGELSRLQAEVDDLTPPPRTAFGRAPFPEEVDPAAPAAPRQPRRRKAG